MQLKQLSRVLITFSPWHPNARAARELLARCSSKKARASNPDCVVEHKITLKGEPVVEVEFTNKEKDTIVASNINVKQIIDRINSYAELMETQKLLKEHGFAGQKLESNWQTEIGFEKEVGTRWNVPTESW